MLCYDSIVGVPEATVARRGRKTEKQRDGDRHEELECKTRQDGSDNMNTKLCVLSSKMKALVWTPHTKTR